jgi:hypothetical protein
VVFAVLAAVAFFVPENGKPSYSFGSINGNNGIIAPGATAPITQNINTSPHRWEPLSADEQSAIRTELGSIPRPTLMRVLCSDGDGRDLGDTFVQVFHDSGWPIDPPIYNAGASPVGVSVNQRDTSDRTLADAIEKGTNGRIKVYLRQDDLDSVTLIIGTK